MFARCYLNLYDFHFLLSEWCPHQVAFEAWLSEPSSNKNARCLNASEIESASRVLRGVVGGNKVYLLIGPREIFLEDLWDQSCLCVRPCVRPNDYNKSREWLSWNLVYSFFGSKLRDAQGFFFKFCNNQPSVVKKRQFFSYFLGFLDFKLFQWSFSNFLICCFSQLYETFLFLLLGHLYLAPFK